MEEKKVIYPYGYGDANNLKEGRCVGDRIIIRPLGIMVKKLAEHLDFNKASENDIFEAALEHPFKGEVVAVGDGITSGIEGMKPPSVNVGDIVYYGRKGNNRFRLNFGLGMEELFVLREADCIWVEKKSKKVTKDGN